MGIFGLPATQTAPPQPPQQATAGAGTVVTSTSLAILQDMVDSTTAKQIGQMVADNLATEALLLGGLAVLKRNEIAKIIGL